ncbi:MAG TPA: post-COAP-1 domain-containing protein [Usitatibacter sp.]|jgi:hypothetical protein|nr:post-COAP-1 domain-containing protein [Usitatibacter sp.]
MARALLSRFIAVAAAVVALAAGVAVPMQAQAHWVPAPCDFITSGGFVFKDDGQRANFSADGGCRNGDFWGNVNFVDHGIPFHLNATQITGYLWDPAVPNARDICGWGRLDEDPSTQVQFRIHLVDNGEPGKNDLFGIAIDNAYSIIGNRFYIVSSRKLADGGPGGGNVQLHKSNPSTTAGPGFFELQEWQMCGDLNMP